MGLESLKDYLNESYKKPTLQKAALAHALQQEIATKFDQDVKISFRAGKIVIYCENNVCAAFLELQRTRLLRTVNTLLPRKVTQKEVRIYVRGS